MITRLCKTLLQRENKIKKRENVCLSSHHWSASPVCYRYVLSTHLLFTRINSKRPSVRGIWLVDACGSPSPTRPSPLNLSTDLFSKNELWRPPPLPSPPQRGHNFDRDRGATASTAGIRGHSLNVCVWRRWRCLLASAPAGGMSWAEPERKKNKQQL